MLRMTFLTRYQDLSYPAMLKALWWWWSNEFCIMQTTVHDSWFSSF